MNTIFKKNCWEEQQDFKPNLFCIIYKRIQQAVFKFYSVPVT